MTKLLNHINTYADLTAFNNDMGKDFPNISYIQGTDEVKWNKYDPYPRVIAKYNVTSTSEETKLLYVNNSNIKQEIIDGIIQDTVKNTYTFDTLGEHIVEYELNDTTYLGQNMFEDCKSLTSVFIPNTVTTYKDQIFKSCSNLSSVSLSHNCKTISSEMFARCSSLTNISLPNDLLYINDNFAFYVFTSIEKIIIPDTIISIGHYAFGNCTSLTSITVLATTPPTLSPMYVFDNTNNCPIYVPAESVDAYKTARGWSTYADRIQSIS